jgi:hypothetical protein
MNPGLKIKSLYILVGVLLLINIATLGFIWYTTIKIKTEQEMRPPRPDNKGSFLADELGFTGEQLNKFDTLRKEHHQRVQKIIREAKELKDQLFDCIKTEDDAKAKEFAGKLSENNKAMELLTYEHFKEVRKICKEEQKVKFDRILIELVRGLEAQSPPPMGAPPPEDRRPPGDRPPPGERPPGR